MEVRQLRSFLTVCESKSINKGAQRLFISPQALSRTISSLEDEFRMPLFIRSPKGLELTDAGELLKILSNRAIGSIDNITREMNILYQSKNHNLSIGMTSGMEYYLSENDFFPFKETHENCIISLGEYSHDSCEELVANGILVAALLYGPVDTSKVKVICSFKRNRVCVMTKDNPLSKKSVISISDLKDEALIATINKHCFKRFEHLCDTYGFEPDFTKVDDSATVFLKCTQDGYIDINLDFVVANSAYKGHHELAAVPIDNNEFPYYIHLIVSPTESRSIALDLATYIRNMILERNDLLYNKPIEL